MPYEHRGIKMLLAGGWECRMWWMNSAQCQLKDRGTSLHSLFQGLIWEKWVTVVCPLSSAARKQSQKGASMGQLCNDRVILALSVSISLYFLTTVLALQNKGSPVKMKHCGWICWLWDQIIQRHKIGLNSRIWLNAHLPSHPWFHVSW